MNQTLRTKLHAFGITGEGAHYPDEGAAPRVVDGVVTWIIPVTEKGKCRYDHRMRARCPDCGAEMSAGRMHQHRGTAKCLANSNGHARVKTTRLNAPKPKPAAPPKREKTSREPAHPGKIRLHGREGTVRYFPES